MRNYGAVYATQESAWFGGRGLRMRFVDDGYETLSVNDEFNEIDVNRGELLSGLKQRITTHSRELTANIRYHLVSTVLGQHTALKPQRDQAMNRHMGDADGNRLICSALIGR